MSNIEYRTYRDSDYEHLVDIIDTTWGYSESAGPKHGRMIAELSLLEVLQYHTFSQIAVKDSVPIGFIFGRLAEAPAQDMYQERMDQITQTLSKHVVGSIALSFYRKYKKIDKTLLQDAGKTYGAELSYFALSKDSQGLGVGKTLYRAFLDYIRGEGVKEYFLYTDTDCNFGFYEHYGMVRRCAKQTGCPLFKKTQMEFYLYDGIVQPADE